MTANHSKYVIIAFITILALLSFGRISEAIPVFARKYKTSCMTCHSAFPKLNPFGETFRRNGYQIPKVNARYVKEKAIKLGAPAWKEVWPEGVWPGELPKTTPIALLARSFYRYDSGSQVKHDLTLPNEIKLLSAGTLGNDISFFGGVALVKDGNKFGGVERLFLQFNNLFTDTLPLYLINIKIGQFEPGIVPLSKHRRLTRTKYRFSTTEVGNNDFTLSDQRGIEVNGFVRSRMEYALGIVNGNGTGDMVSGSLDNNSKKDLYLKMGYKFGGIGLDGSGVEAGLLPGDWKESSIHIGVFGYIGENRIPSTGIDDRFYRYGLDLNLIYRDINIMGTVISGSHKNPNGDFQERDIFSYLIESDVNFYPWLIGILRYDFIDVEDVQKSDDVVIGLVALIRANVKLTVEGELHTIGGGSERAFVILEFAI
jgi:hypothetical protein